MNAAVKFCKYCESAVPPFHSVCASCKASHKKDWLKRHNATSARKADRADRKKTSEARAKSSEYHGRPEVRATRIERSSSPAYKKVALEARRKPERLAQSAAHQKLRRANPEESFKCKARVALSGAIRSGKMVKPGACSKCGGGPVQGHHHDYSQPLNVTWLCVMCHNDEHQSAKGHTKERY